MILPLEKRQFYTGYCPPDTNCSSAWNDYVRWIVLAAIIILFLFIFFFCSCLTARRRRRAGQQPYYGTGWATRLPPYSQHNTGGGAWHQPAPPYTRDAPPDYLPQQTQQHHGFFGPASHTSPQQNGTIELQQPGGSYFPAGRERQGEYAPPVGPPPATNKKGDVVVR